MSTLPATKQFFFQTGQRMTLCILWLAGLLAFFGCFWRQQSLSPGFVAAVMLALWTEFLVRCCCQTSTRQEKILCWIPVMLLGLLFPFWEMLTYAVTVAGLEAALHFVRPYWFSAKKLSALKPPFPVNPAATQVIQRFRTEDGHERLEATLSIDFMESQKMAVFHVPFCPAFPSVPEIETRIENNIDATVTVTTVQPFGVRIEIKRAAEMPNRLRVVLLARS